ncbi:BQ5605_C030g10787 [Microbotryum silenes-dioicae]|uniref:BQ5605_C030g10787 protein n=1 Tax=Microbotryum silenes-dioicae TaxID=796604 RepID=A0A2X0MLP2_9BASI|nr:BQ5605_C030g10787 [Microbotryum silenes-dioicae]
MWKADAVRVSSGGCAEASGHTALFRTYLGRSLNTTQTGFLTFPTLVEHICRRTKW